MLEETRTMLAGRSWISVSLSMHRETAASVMKSPGTQLLWVCRVLSTALSGQPETDFTHLQDSLATNDLDKVLGYHYTVLEGLCPW